MLVLDVGVAAEFVGASEMRRYVRIAAAATALGLAASLSVVLPAQAQATGEDWWYDRMNVAAAHAERWAGEGITIAVIDNRINPDLEVFAGTDLTVDPNSLCPNTSNPDVIGNDEEAFHGSQVVAMLIGNGTGPGTVQGIVPDAKVLFYGMGFANHDPGADDECGSSMGNVEGVEDGIIRAIDAGADVISVSMMLGTPNPVIMRDSYARALAMGVVIVAAADNGTGFDHGAPAPFGMNGVVGVAAIKDDGTIAGDEDSDDPLKLNIHPEVTVVAPGENIRSVGWQSEIDEQLALLNPTPEATPEETPNGEPAQETPDPLAEAGNSLASTMLWVGIGAAVVGVAAVVVVLIVLTRSQARARKE